MIDFEFAKEHQLKRVKIYLNVARHRALRQARTWLEGGMSLVEFWEGKLGSKSSSAVKEELPRKRSKKAPKKTLKSYIAAGPNPLTEKVRLHHRTARHH